MTSRVGNCMLILDHRWRCWLCLADGRICCPSAADLTSESDIRIYTSERSQMRTQTTTVLTSDSAPQIWLSGHSEILSNHCIEDPSCSLGRKTIRPLSLRHNTRRNNIRLLSLRHNTRRNNIRLVSLCHDLSRK